MLHSTVWPRAYASIAIGLCISVLLLFTRSFTDLHIFNTLPTTRGSSGTQNSSIEQSEVTVAYAEHGLVLNDTITRFTSPNQRYVLQLEVAGNVVLRDEQANVDLWWSNTGDGPAQAHRMTLSEQGRLEIDSDNPPRRHQPPGTWETVWHSDFLLQCAESLSHRGEQLGSEPSRLSLSNDGELAIEKVCVIHKGRETSATDMTGGNGRLGLVVSGLYRTNKQACRSQMAKVVENPAFREVDVFVYALYENRDVEIGLDADIIEQDIRDCYGDKLREVTVKHVDEVAEAFPGGFYGECGSQGKADRLYSQLKTLYLSGRLWWNWSLRTGTQHDTVLRLRCDTEFRGEKLPDFMSTAHVGDGRLVLPHPAPGNYFYCPTPNAGLRVGE